MTTSRAPISEFAAAQAPTLAAGVAGGGPPSSDDSLLWATPYVVSSDVDAPYQTVQPALDAIVADGRARALLLLEPGTYAENLNLLVSADQTIVVQALGGNAEDEQLVNFQGDFFVDLSPPTAASVTFNGCRFTNPGATSLNAALGAGAPGAVPQLELASCALVGRAIVQVTTQDAIFRADRCTVDGINVSGATIEATDCEFTAPSDAGVAVSIASGAALVTDALFRSCRFVNAQLACLSIDNAGPDGDLVRVLDCTFGVADPPFGPVTGIQVAYNGPSPILRLQTLVVRDCSFDLPAFASIGIQAINNTIGQEITIQRSVLDLGEAGICVSYQGENGDIRVTDSLLTAGDDGIAVEGNTPGGSIALFGQNSTFAASSAGSPVGSVIVGAAQALDVTLEGAYTHEDATVRADGDRGCLETNGIVLATGAIFRQSVGGLASFAAIRASNGATLRECEVRADGACVDGVASAVLVQQSTLQSADAPFVVSCGDAQLRNVRLINLGAGAGVLTTGVVNVQQSRIDTSSGSGFAGISGAVAFVTDCEITCNQTCISADEVVARNTTMLTQSDQTTVVCLTGATVTIRDCDVTCAGLGGGSAVECLGDLVANNVRFSSRSNNPCLNVAGASTLRNCDVEVTTGGGACLFGSQSLEADTGAVNLQHCRVNNASGDAGASAVVCSAAFRTAFTQLQSQSSSPTAAFGGEAAINNCVIRNNSSPFGPPALDVTAGGQLVRVQNSEITGGAGTAAVPTITTTGGGGNELRWGQLTTFDTALIPFAVSNAAGIWALTSVEATPVLVP